MAELTIIENEQYKHYVVRWQRVEDIIDGEARLKERDLKAIQSYNSVDYTMLETIGSIRYLRPIMQNDRSSYNLNRNANYIRGARLYNATTRTLSGLMGMMFRVEPTVNEDDLGELDYLISNVDGAGTDLDQQAMGVGRAVTSIGRNGLLVDMPRNDDGQEVTKARVKDGFKATIQSYHARSIKDWDESIVNGAKVLSMLLLHEVDMVIDSDDELCIRRTPVDKYKLYRLDDGVVTVQFITTGEKGLEKGEVLPVNDSKGQMKSIPFVFIGSVNNMPNIDPLPLEPIADINVGHYQESANLASTSFNLSAAQPWIADDNYQREIRNNDNQDDDKAVLGEESLIVLGTGGTFNVTAPPDNPLASAIAKGYEEQMVALGAQLITNSSGNETAEAAKIKHASDVSVLDTIANNISDAYTKCIKWAGDMMGIETEAEYQVNRIFFESTLGAQDLDALVRTWQAGAVSKEVLDKKLVSGKVIPQGQDLDEMNKDIEAEADMPDLDAPVIEEVVEPDA